LEFFYLAFKFEVQFLFDNRLPGQRNFTLSLCKLASQILYLAFKAVPFISELCGLYANFSD
jgi:hypothetical protein